MRAALRSVQEEQQTLTKEWFAARIMYGKIRSGIVVVVMFERTSDSGWNKKMDLALAVRRALVPTKFENSKFFFKNFE
jgi:hypothetical protein